MAGQEIDGPAIVEQPDTTTVVYPGQRLRVDEAGNLVIHVPVRERPEPLRLEAGVSIDSGGRA